MLRHFSKILFPAFCFLFCFKCDFFSTSIFQAVLFIWFSTSNHCPGWTLSLGTQALIIFDKLYSFFRKLLPSIFSPLELFLESCWTSWIELRGLISLFSVSFCSIFWIISLTFLATLLLNFFYTFGYIFNFQHSFLK